MPNSKLNRRCFLGAAGLVAAGWATKVTATGAAHAAAGRSDLEIRGQEHYGEAEKSFQAALQEAQHFDPNDSRLAASFHDLADVYQAQGQRTMAELMYKRALEIREEAKGPDHPGVATTLEKLADLYTKTGRDDEAKKLHERAKRIRAGQ